MGHDTAKEPVPRRAWASTVQQEMRAGLVLRIHANATPMVVRHHVADGNMMFIHQERCELSRVLNGARKVVSMMLTHLDTDTEVVTRTIEVCVLALLIRG